MTYHCATTRFLLAACAWLGLICQQVTVACGCCTFVTGPGSVDQAPASGVDGKNSTSACCGPRRCGPNSSNHNSSNRTCSSNASQNVPASDCSGPCCGSCCEDVPVDTAVLVSRLPVPTATGVLTPIVNDEPDKARTGTRSNDAGGAAEVFSLQRRLARLGVWLN